MWIYGFIDASWDLALSWQSSRYRRQTRNPAAREQQQQQQGMVPWALSDDFFFLASLSLLEQTEGPPEAEDWESEAIGSLSAGGGEAEWIRGPPDIGGWMDGVDGWMACSWWSPLVGETHSNLFFFFNDNPIRHKNSQAGRQEIGGVAQKKIVPGDGQALDRNDLLLPRFRVRRSARNMPSSG